MQTVPKNKKTIVNWMLCNVIALIIGAICGFLYFQKNFNTYLEVANNEADRFLTLTSSFVSHYSVILDEQAIDSAPVPASFRARASETFNKNYLGDTRFVARMVGMPNRYIVTAPDADLGASLVKMSESLSNANHSELLEKDGGSMVRTMYPSIANSASCIECHNRIQNLDVPWALGDVMGAYVIESSVHEIENRYRVSAIVFGLLVTISILSLIIASKFYLDLRKQSGGFRLLANTDPLTGCMNRRAFDDLVKQRWRTESGNSALLILDIDYFKRVNDDYGHDVGDAVLVGFVETVQSVLRKNDEIARIGGEEFIVYLPKTSEELAKSVAERIRHTLEKVVFDIDGVSISVTVSIGGVHTGRAPNNPIALYKKIADVYLYKAKESGRNRLSWAMPMPSSY